MSNLQFIADGHVHIYPFMSIQNVLDSAYRNFSDFCELSNQNGSVGFLCIADPDNVNGYDRLLAIDKFSGPDAVENWVRLDEDSRSVVLRHSSGADIVAIKGQQLITSEGLEVLGIGYNATLKSGLTLPNTVAKIRNTGGWSVLAWGVGKWLGRRGRLVTDLIMSESESADVMLTDNGGRPWCWSRVSQFELARERGMRILAGTDPLPLKGEECRIGSYGFSHQLKRNAGESMLGAFCRMLEDSEVAVRMTGPNMSIGRFVSNQLRLRLRPVSS